MHSAVDWFAYAIWEKDGTLRRALSLSPDSGIWQDVGDRLPFEERYWAGDEEFLKMLEEDGEEYPFVFHPLELAEAALRELFGFVYEGMPHEDDPDLAEIVLAGFLVPRQS